MQKTTPSKKASRLRSGQASHQWNLKRLYASPVDPQIQNDVEVFEKSVDAFAKKYDTAK